MDPSAPLTTRTGAQQRREPATRRSAAPAHKWRNRQFDAVPDRVDVRDWVYQPSLVALPDVVVNCDAVPDILDQGREGACTGFALGAVINYLLHGRGLINPRQQARFVSPRMLYELARKYDEWPGEDYEGSSARGAMQAWVAHGVCRRPSWPDDQHGADHFSQAIAAEAQESPGGAYYRVSHREVRDMHAALHETGILYVTLMVHDGWFFPGVGEEDFHRLDGSGKLPDGTAPARQTARISYTSGPGNSRDLELPVIQRIGSAASGHAVALVGYTHTGFIVQNSWGRGWGADGFALLPYEDYLLHATDVWVAQLGVPVKLDLWSAKQIAEGTGTAAGMSRAATAIPLNEIRPFVIDIGNDGKLSDSGQYWTTESDLEELIGKTIPEATAAWDTRRILLYLHGGLNDERAVAARVVAFRDVFLANQVYPVHVMWESGLRETVSNMIEELLTGPDPKAGGVRDWIDKFREGLVDAKDRAIEVTLGRPGRALWDEMKENARRASERADRKGAMQLLSAIVGTVVEQMEPSQRRNWELHIVGHSAGSIFVAHAIELLVGLGIPIKTVQLFAPAMTIRLFKEKLRPLIGRGKPCPLPALYVLSDTGERDDAVGPYGKSLLYLVSNAFEVREGDERKKGYTPILGMQRFLQDINPEGPRVGDEAVDAEMRALYSGAGQQSLIVAGAAARNAQGSKTGTVSESRSHGGFDNDYQTLNSALFRMVGAGGIRRPFTTRDLQY